MMTVSSSYLANALSQPVQQAQSALATAVAEMASGQYADLGLQLGAQSGQELSTRNMIGSLQGYSTDNAVLSTRLQSASTALDTMRTGAQTALQNVVAWTSSGASGATLQTQGQAALQGLIAGANASAGDQYVFGGINSGAPPVSDYYATPTSAAKTAVDAAFQTQFGFAPTDPQAANITSSQMQGFLAGPFAALFQGSQWTSNWSSASSANVTDAVAPGQSVTNPVNANDGAFQQLAQAYTMMSQFGGTQISQSALGVVASAAASLITQGQSGMTQAEASVGAAQQAVTNANSSLSSQTTLLQAQLASFDNINANAVATQVSALQTQIQVSYSLTARLQTMTLAQYLPVA